MLQQFVALISIFITFVCLFSLMSSADDTRATLYRECARDFANNLSSSDNHASVTSILSLYRIDRASRRASTRLIVLRTPLFNPFDSIRLTRSPVIKRQNRQRSWNLSLTAIYRVRYLLCIFVIKPEIRILRGKNLCEFSEESDFLIIVVYSPLWIIKVFSFAAHL